MDEHKNGTDEVCVFHLFAKFLLASVSNAVVVVLAEQVCYRNAHI